VGFAHKAFWWFLVPGTWPLWGRPGGFWLLICIPPARGRPPALVWAGHKACWWFLSLIRIACEVRQSSGAGFGGGVLLTFLDGVTFGAQVIAFGDPGPISNMYLSR
jgi:hypothetical protein